MASVQSLVQADGKILVGGAFNGGNSIGGQSAQPRSPGSIRTTGLADSFDPNANSGGTVCSLAVQADGKILAGGAFHEHRRTSRAQLHRPAEQ